MKNNRRKLFGSVVVAAGALVALMGCSLYQAARWVPPFYAEKLALNARILEAAESEMQQQVRNLHTDVLKRDEWQALFTDAQINGWLAGGLKKKFPRAIPPALSSPRIAISHGEAKLACQYTVHNPPTVVSLVMDVFLTHQQNVIGLRLKSTRFGAVPGFMDEVVRNLTAAARRSRIPLRWTQIDDDPVALVWISPTIIDQEHLITLASFELRDGAVYVAGQTRIARVNESPEPATRPRSYSLKFSRPRPISRRTVHSSAAKSSNHR